MYRLLSFATAFLLFAGCSSTQDIAEDVGIVDDEPATVQTQPQQVAATEAVPRGTVLNARLVDTISPQAMDEGDQFRARITSNLYARDGDVLVPEGALIRGTVTGIDESDHVGDQAAVRLDFDEITMRNRAYDLGADVVNTAVEARGTREIDEEHVAAGAAAGAALGAILTGDLGDALLGGALGAGAGTLVSLGTGEVDPVIPSGSVLTLQTEDRISI